MRSPDGGAALPVRVSVRLYRVLLLRYPARLRREHGEAMAEAFRALLLEEWSRRDGGLGRWLVRAWWRVGVDLLRPVPGPSRRGEVRWWTRLGEDVGSAARSLRREPRVSLLLVAVLGVGIAFSSSVFAVVNAYVIRPLPYPEPERLVDIRTPTEAVGWRDVGHVLELAVSWDLDVFTIVGEGDPELAPGAWVTPDFFDLYGIRPALGRALLPEDAVEGGAAVALISHRLWLERFGADGDVLGRTFRAFTSDRPDDAETFTVIGVLPEDFWHFNTYTDVLAPLRADGSVYAGRMRNDVLRPRAEEILTRMAVSAAVGEVAPGFRVTVRSMQDAYTEEVRPTLWVLQAAALLVLLIAFANAAVLLLVRAAGRKAELGVRQALGAGAGRLTVQLVAEGVLLAGAAGVLGLLLGQIGLDAVAEVIPERLGRRVPGGAEAFRPDRTVLVATTSASGLIGAVLGAATLWVAGRRNLVEQLSGSGRGGSDAPGPRRARAGLVAAELALSLTLLVGAGLLVQSALHLHTADIGFDSRRLLKGTIGLRQRSYAAEDRRLAFYESLLTRTGELPGVEHAALVMPAPFVGPRSGTRLEAEGGPQSHVAVAAAVQVVSPGYFATLGIPVLRGRDFSEQDGPGGSRVAVVSTGLAERLWPGEEPIGRRLRVAEGSGESTPGAWLNVVGLVPDVTQWAGDDIGELYVPLPQSLSFWTSVVVRHRSSTTAVVEGVETVLRDLDPEIPFYSVTDVEEAVALSRAPTRFLAVLLGGFATFAALLTCLGVYGVVAYAVRQRRRDVAIRMAIGAGGGAVQALFVRQGAGVVAVGLAVGIMGGRSLGSALEGLLHGVSAGDPLTFTAVTTLLGVTTLVATWLPARGAAATQPMEVLREE